MMYKLIAIDLDETLYDDNRNICQRNVEAIMKAKELGVKIVPCSGRTPKFLGNLYSDLDIDKDEEYSILGNGGITIENKSNRTIDIHPLSFEKAKELFIFGRKHNLCVQIFLKDRIYFYYADDNEKDAVSGFGKNLIFKEDDDLSVVENEEIIKVLFEKEDMPYLRTLEEPLKEITEGEVSVSFSSNRYVELNRYGINKGLGLRDLANYLHIDISETIGIGDNLNDKELIEEAGLGCAVANAIEMIKEKADYICESDNNEGAVAEVIEKFILNEVE